jgi:hypothetical protein
MNELMSRFDRSDQPLWSDLFIDAEKSRSCNNQRYPDHLVKEEPGRLQRFQDIQVNGKERNLKQTFSSIIPLDSHPFSPV